MSGETVMIIFAYVYLEHKVSNVGHGIQCVWFNLYISSIEVYE